VPFGSLQFTITEVESVLLDLDDAKGPGPDGVPSLVVLKSFVCAFAVPSYLLFISVFLDAWKLSFVPPFFKSGRRNDVVNYRYGIL
jgi:hypothetical protein